MSEDAFGVGNDGIGECAHFLENLLEGGELLSQGMGVGIDLLVGHEDVLDEEVSVEVGDLAGLVGVFSAKDRPLILHSDILIIIYMTETVLNGSARIKLWRLVSRCN